MCALSLLISSANQDENEDGESTSKKLKSEHGKTRVSKTIDRGYVYDLII